LQQAGCLSGAAGELGQGLYTRENVAKVYDEVLRQAGLLLRRGTSVILDGTWRDQRQRERARKLAADNAVPLVELTCTLPLEAAAARIVDRTESSSDATPQIAAALATDQSLSSSEYHIDTRQPLADSVAEAHRICCLAI
jgi:predicted kinase